MGQAYGYETLFRILSVECKGDGSDREEKVERGLLFRGGRWRELENSGKISIFCSYFWIFEGIIL